MMTDQEHVVYLWRQYLTEKASFAELEELLTLIRQSGNNDQHILILKEEVAKLGEQARYSVFQDESWEETVRLISEREKFALKSPVRSVFRLELLSARLFRYAAVAVVVLGLGVLAVIGLRSKQAVQLPAEETSSVSPEVDVLPGSDKAILTLDDGKMITLDSSASRVLRDHGIENDNATVFYNSVPKTVSVNTLTTPRGGQYKLRLSDGTMVWLNAASSIRYPTFFKGREREVTITGEAYFEVAKDADRPFIVRTHAESIMVLGTRFNVNAYADEASVKTSLVEGSVKINQTILKPGSAYVDGKITNTDILQDIAWKDGYFNFNGADLPTVMRQLSRWYDIEVEYSSALVKNQKFGGKMGRDLTLGQVLKLLSSADMHFRQKGKTVIVSP